MTIDAADFDLLIARAINSAKATHLPTYAALRILLKSGENFRPVLTHFTNRRCLNREEWRYYPFQILKERSSESDPTYRDCFAGSPLTILAESVILKIMSQEPSFAVPDCAFSYLWPDFRLSGKNYAHYFDGYRRRNACATELISDGSGNVGIIMDIKSFYPTINREKLKEKVADRVSRFGDQNDRRRVAQFLNRYLSVNKFGERGIAIGPDISHALGHLALDDVDREAKNRFGNRYLRYVDDIIVIVKQSEVDDAVAFIRGLLAREDLVPNETKTDIVEQAVWMRANVTDRLDPEGTFDSLFDAITLHLVANPNSLVSLQRAFRDEGFSIPMSRLQSRAKSSRFRAYLFSKVSRVSWFFSWFWMSEAALVDQAKLVRQQYLEIATSQSQESIPTAPMQRRWHIQKRRFFLNRLLHLLTGSEYDKLLGFIPEVDEFFELRFVTNALRTGDASNVLAYPGRLLHTICQLWPEQMRSQNLKIAWPTSPSVAEADSAATIAMTLSISPPSTFMDKLKQNNPDAKRLIEFCSCKQSEDPSSESGSYLDEISDLHCDMKQSEVVELMSTRYNELEDVGLDGLRLGEMTSASWSNSKDQKA